MEAKTTPSSNKRTLSGRQPNMTRRVVVCVVGLLSLWIISLYYPEVQIPRLRSVNNGCLFPLPNHLFKERPLQLNEGRLASSSKKLHNFFSKRTSHSDIDSLSIAVVTPTGTIFERSYGVLKANESESGKPVSRDSIYRVASITKMFTILETLILRERGALDLDDAVENLLPDLNYPAYGWSDYLQGRGINGNSQGPKPRVTLRQLASHMSGFGRDYPPLEVSEWPENPPILINQRMGTQNEVPLPERSYEQLVKSVNKYPLINLPYDYPIYSNTGIELLGLANVAANNRSKTHPLEREPQTHEDLVRRDIFKPLGLNSSFYRIPYGTSLVEDLAVPKKDHEWTDFVFDSNSYAPAGGQYSSLADLEVVMQSFLDSARNKGVVSEHVIREWLHPLFTWKNGFQETGGPWEIMTVEGVKLYMKGGNLPGYHSEFVLIPEFQYGIIVLVTGTYANTASLVQKVVTLFQPAIRSLLEERISSTYTGKWTGISLAEKGTSSEVKIIKGGLYMTELIVRGHDVLKIVQNAVVDLRKPNPVALWSTGRPGEFRLAFGRTEINSDPTAGCWPYWLSIDNPLFGRGAPIDLVLWDGNQLLYPSAGTRLKRVD